MQYDAWPLAYTEHGGNLVNHSLKTSIHWNIDFHKVIKWISIMSALAIKEWKAVILFRVNKDLSI